MASETKVVKLETRKELIEFLRKQNDRIGLAEEWIIYLEAKVKQLESRRPRKGADAIGEPLPPAPTREMNEFYGGAGKIEHTKE